jgi:hypothetical protein
MNLGRVLPVTLAAALMLMGSPAESLARHYRAPHETIHDSHHNEHHGYDKTKKVASIAAPIAIGAAFGPVGSVSYQVVKHRKWIARHLFHR